MLQYYIQYLKYQWKPILAFNYKYWRWNVKIFHENVEAVLEENKHGIIVANFAH